MIALRKKFTADSQTVSHVKHERSRNWIHRKSVSQLFTELSSSCRTDPQMRQKLHYLQSLGFGSNAVLSLSFELAESIYLLPRGGGSTFF